MATVIQRSFSGGEISPALYARADLVKYATGLRTCRNVIILKHGGGSNRSGTEFDIEVKDSTKETRLIPFIFNSDNDQAYALEFGDGYMRVHKDCSPIRVSGLSAYAGGTTYAIGDLVSDAGVNYYCIQSGSGHTPASSPTYWHPLTDDIFEMPIPYGEADLFDITYDQSGDVMTFNHPNYRTYELRRTSDTGWTIPVVTFSPSISTPTGLASNSSGTTYYYVITAIKKETYEESLPTDPVGSSTQTSTLSWNVVADAVEYNIYKKKNGVFGLIGISDSTQFIDSTITPDESDTAPIKRNPFAVTPIKTVTIHTAGASDRKSVV